MTIYIHLRDDETKENIRKEYTIYNTHYPSTIFFPQYVCLLAQKYLKPKRCFDDFGYSSRKGAVCCSQNGDKNLLLRLEHAVCQCVHNIVAYVGANMRCCHCCCCRWCVVYAEMLYIALRDTQCMPSQQQQQLGPNTPTATATVAA